MGSSPLNKPRPTGTVYLVVPLSSELFVTLIYETVGGLHSSLTLVNSQVLMRVSIACRWYRLFLRHKYWNGVGVNVPFTGIAGPRLSENILTKVVTNLTTIASNAARNRQSSVPQSFISQRAERRPPEWMRFSEGCQWPPAP